MLIRNLRENETELLRDFLYEAIFIPEGVTPPPREIIEQPELRIYYENFGTSKADHCLVAEDAEEWSELSGHVSWMTMGMWTMKLRHLLSHCTRSIAVRG